MTTATEKRRILNAAAPEIYDRLRDIVNAGHPQGMDLPAYRRAEELLRRLLPIEQETAPEPAGAICEACGYEGAHASPDACIDALRSALESARWDLTNERHERRKEAK